MNIAEDVDPDDTQAYPNRPAWQRFITIFAGPATNYLSAIVLALALYTCHGVDGYGVGETMAGFDAHGKLVHGDTIREVDHVPLYFKPARELSERVNAANGVPINLTIERDGKLLDVMIK